MPNHEPKGRVSLRLLVLAGSLEETDSQQASPTTSSTWPSTGASRRPTPPIPIAEWMDAEEIEHERSHNQERWHCLVPANLRIIPAEQIDSRRGLSR